MIATHTRRMVLLAAQQVCPNSPEPPVSADPLWGPLVHRMKALISATGDDAARLDRFGRDIGLHLDDMAAMAKILDGEWMELLGKVVGSVVSAETKAKRLNCATCSPADFPVLLPVIQALAWGAPSKMWDPLVMPHDSMVVGMMDYDRPPADLPRPRREPPRIHYDIADKTWYRPQLAMLVTALWPNLVGLAYYQSTIVHVLDPEQPPGPPSDDIAAEGMIMPPNLDDLL